MNREPVLVVGAVLAALQVIVSGSVLADAIGQQAAGLAGLVVAALTVGLSTYTRSKVTPVDTADGGLRPPPAAPTADAVTP